MPAVSPETKAAILVANRDGLSLRAIASEFGLNYHVVRNIVIESQTAQPDLVAAVARLAMQQAEILARLAPPPAVQEPLQAVEEEVKDDAPVAGGTIASPETKVRVADGRRFVLTCAQNNTYVHPGFMDALARFCGHTGAELLISRFGYNTKGWRQPEKDGGEDLWYDPRIEPFVCDEPVRLARDLIFCGELNISPTAVDPMSGLDTYTKSASAVIPHVKVAMRSLATMKSQPARLIYTTGTVTQRNYIERKAGQKASFHHVFGALYVEVDDQGDWFARQLVASDDGTFQDLETVYSPDGVYRGHVECVTWGDFHEEKADPEIHAACFGPGGILETLRPRQQHVHDLLDQRARNHHNVKDPYFLAEMRAAGTESVEADIATCARKLEAIERPWCQTVVVESNHDQAFRRWLCEADGHRDAPNAAFWHYWNFRIFEGIAAFRKIHVFEEAVRANATSPLTTTTFLKEDDSWIICPDQGGGIECGLHGHRGPNGSRASPKGFKALGTRCNTAHTHSPGVIEGVWTAGVSGSLNMGYNVGPSSWCQAHIVTYPSGKRAIIVQRGRKWRASKPKVRVRVKAVSSAT